MAEKIFKMAGVTNGAAFALAGGSGDDALSANSMQGVGNGAVTFINDASAPTGKAFYVNGASGDTIRNYWGWTSAKVARFCHYIEPRNTPGGDVEIFYVVDTVFGQSFAYRISSGRQIKHTNAANSHTTMTPVLAVNSRYRVEGVLQLATTPDSGNGSIQFELFADESLTPLSGGSLISSTYNLGTNNFLRLQGPGKLSTGQAWQMYADTLRGEIGSNTTPFGPYNQAPTVTIDAPNTACEPLKTYSHVATGNDLEGGSLAYAWTVVSGPLTTGDLIGANTATVSYKAPLGVANSTLALRCTVTDDGGLTGIANVSDAINGATRLIREGGVVKAATVVTRQNA